MCACLLLCRVCVFECLCVYVFVSVFLCVVFSAVSFFVSLPMCEFACVVAFLSVYLCACCVFVCLFVGLLA